MMRLMGGYFEKRMCVNERVVDDREIENPKTVRRIWEVGEMMGTAGWQPHLGGDYEYDQVSMTNLRVLTNELRKAEPVLLHSRASRQLLSQIEVVLILIPHSDPFKMHKQLN